MNRRRFVLAAALLVASPVGIAGKAPDLLDNERAFAFAARAVDAQTLEARFIVAPGYYLYRDKLRFAVEGATLREEPHLPAGVIHRDEFFGESQTYRGTVLVRIALAGSPPGGTVTLVADSQGCADLGVCYPPQRQKLAVHLPADARPGAFVEAAPARRRWFQ